MDLQRCIRGTRKPSKGPRACMAKLIQFWLGEQHDVSLLRHRKETSRNYSPQHVLRISPEA